VISQAAMAGAGELSIPVIIVVSIIVVSPLSPPWLSLSLGMALLPGGLTSLELSLLVSPLASIPLVREGAPQDDMPHTAPVKDLSCKPFFSQRRQGLPERSRARRPALMAPVLALGPSLWAATLPTGLMGTPPSAERSMEPSGLWRCQ
jgi:hypothetical protein